MKSALLAAIFGITGGVAILLAVPAGEKAPVIKIQLPKSFPEYGEPVVPQKEEVPPAGPSENVVQPATQQSGQRTVKKVCYVVRGTSAIPQPCNRLAAIPTTANPMTIYGHRPGR